MFTRAVLKFWVRDLRAQLLKLPSQTTGMRCARPPSSSRCPMRSMLTLLLISTLPTVYLRQTGQSFSVSAPAGEIFGTWIEYFLKMLSTLSSFSEALEEPNCLKYMNMSVRQCWVPFSFSFHAYMTHFLAAKLNVEFWIFTFFTISPCFFFFIHHASLYAQLYFTLSGTLSNSG